MSYPDYVKQFRPKGTVVKRVNKIYYVYYATSRRIPGKTYPVQVITGLAGKIDEDGFHKLTRAVVDTEHVTVRECGFTNFLLKFEGEYSNRGKGDEEERRSIYRSMIVYLSNNSYLNDETGIMLYPKEELEERFHIDVSEQISVICGISGHSLEELEPLKYICNVKMGNRIFSSDLTEVQKRFMDKLGITEAEVRQTIEQQSYTAAPERFGSPN